ncbi:MAG TPA: hypothetical protein VNK49_05805 [Anaerolineales bacterium]|nr:hypothetical protein [Anaerolineales bacterium]
MNHLLVHSSSSQLRNGHAHKRRVSQRGLLSLAMLLTSLCAFGIAMLGGAKMVFDIFGDVPHLTSIFSKVIVIGIAYGVGWLSAMVAIRVYGNLVLPILIRWLAWGSLAAVCLLYVEILQRLYLQQYGIEKFIKYVLVMAGGLGGMVGLHLIIENHDLRPFSIPLLIIGMIQLGLIVYRYVFTLADPSYLLGDLLFFFGMTVFSILMLAHFGILNPLRERLTAYFDRNSVAIQTQD